MKQRLGTNAQASQRTAQIAFEHGLQHSDAKGRLRRWMDGLYLQHRSANNLRLYGDHAYVFAGEVLITVLHVPHKMRKASRRNR